jgi:diadenosine tetraphosphate (Ap4A) HIT family hydrolase
MNTDPCVSCLASRGMDPSAIGGAVLLPGGWALTHYRGSEGWLGWLALHPRAHRMQLAELSGREAAALGPNIVRIERALVEYWRHAFADDPIVRMYVVYFFESAFQDPPLPQAYHLHIHLIPRFGSLAGGMARSADGATWVDAWKVPEVSASGHLRENYSRQSSAWAERVTALMDHLRQRLGVRAK